MSTIFWDVETFSPVDLRETGAHVYLEDPDTMPICAAWAVDDDKVVPFVPAEATLPFYLQGDDWPFWVTAWEDDEDLMFSGWNSMGFERNAWPKFFPGSKVPPIERWIDTMAESQALGWPRALGQTAEAMGLPKDEQKDKRGKYLIQKLCKPQHNKKLGEHRIWDEELLRELIDYCVKDVIAERAISHKLRRL